MSSPGAGQVDITTLSMEDLEQLYKSMVEEAQFLQQSMGSLRGAQNEFRRTKEAVLDLKDKEEGHPVLLPLTTSLYVEAELQDPNEVMVNLGTGYYAKMDSDKACEYLERKVELLEEKCQLAMQALKGKQQHLNAITQHRQQRIAQYQQQVAQQAGKAPQQ